MNPVTTSVSVFTRHSPSCPRKDDRYWKRCNCRKYLYVYADGQDQTKSAKTRSWEQAEKMAKLELDLRDPEKIEERKKADEKAEKEAAEKASAIRVDDALRLWVTGFKEQSASTAKTYRIALHKISSWATTQGITCLRNVTPAQLDKWRADWSPKATRKEDRMGPTTQNQFLKRVKAFFRWAYEFEHIQKDPAKALKSIAFHPEKTMPLTSEQFDQVLAAVDLCDVDRKRKEDRFGVELRAVCLVMRWTGLRITDVLMLPRIALDGNLLNLTTLKTKEDTLAVLPDHAVAALKAIAPRAGVSPAYFFWTTNSSPHTLGKHWAVRFKRLNAHLNLTDDHGQPMKFHSHQLRDTFAVELLLAGYPIETVSKMLTHKSVRVTETHYAPWVKSRQKQLQVKAIEALRKMGATVGGK